MGAMRSLASQSRSAKIKDALQGADLETNVTKDPDGPEEFHTVASSSPDPEASLVQAEEQAAAQALLDEIYSHLGEDWQVRLVIDGWREGHAGPALRANLGLSEREYNTDHPEDSQEGRPLPRGEEEPRCLSAISNRSSEQ